jgi:hypothetical protein
MRCDNEALYKGRRYVLVNDKLNALFSYELTFWADEILDDVHVMAET